jgi:lysozyme
MNKKITSLDLLMSIIREFEGCRLKSYKDFGGIWTVGWGATGKGINKDTVWTQEQADEALHDRALGALHDAIKESPILTHETIEIQAAIADFIYNCGVGNYRTSTLKKRVDVGDWVSAKKEIMRWDKVKGKPLAGLTRRRKVESNLLSD